MSYHFEVGDFDNVLAYEQWLNDWSERGYELVDVQMNNSRIMATMKGSSYPHDRYPDGTPVRPALTTGSVIAPGVTPIPQRPDPGMPEKREPRYSPPRSEPGRYK